jgi:hypothetical protein
LDKLFHRLGVFSDDSIFVAALMAKNQMKTLIYGAERNKKGLERQQKWWTIVWTQSVKSWLKWSARLGLLIARWNAR